MKEVIYHPFDYLCNQPFLLQREQRSESSKARQGILRENSELGKKSHLERYADDIARVKSTKVSCVSCAGTGYVGYSTCDNCDGDGWVYRIERR